MLQHTSREEGIEGGKGGKEGGREEGMKRGREEGTSETCLVLVSMHREAERKWTQDWGLNSSWLTSVSRAAAREDACLQQALVSAESPDGL